MGFVLSTSQKRSKKDDDVPRFASLYHSWMGYGGFFYQLLLGLMAFTMIVGYFQTNATVVLLSFAVITFIIYIALFWTNSRWYGVTFTTRRYLQIDMNETLQIVYDLPSFD